MTRAASCRDFVRLRRARVVVDGEGPFSLFEFLDLNAEGMTALQIRSVCGLEVGESFADDDMIVQRVADGSGDDEADSETDRREAVNASILAFTRRS